MVAQHLFPPHTTSEQTLDVVWRSTTERVSLRGAVLLLLLGLGGVAARVITDRFDMLASLGILASAFACSAMLTRSGGAEGGLPPSVMRILSGMLKIIAALAGVATGLLLLVAVFGGSLEVMRH